MRNTMLPIASHDQFAWFTISDPGGGIYAIDPQNAKFVYRWP